MTSTRSIVTRALAATGLAVLAMPRPAAADEWQNTMLFYLVGAALEGESQVGPFATDVDASFSDILDNLDAGFMGSYQASRNDWTYAIDAMYTGLGPSGTGPAGVRANLDIDQLIVSVDVAYRTNEYVELLGGARYNSLELGLELVAPGGVIQRSNSEDWIDPYLGVRATIPFSPKWSLTLRGDIGGFDVGSEFAWHVVARVDWWVSESLFLNAGYRILDTDYEDGSGPSLFRYDMTMSGPAAGIGWRF